MSDPQGWGGVSRWRRIRLQRSDVGDQTPAFRRATTECGRLDDGRVVWKQCAAIHVRTVLAGLNRAFPLRGQSGGSGSGRPYAAALTLRKRSAVPGVSSPPPTPLSLPSAEDYATVVRGPSPMQLEIRHADRVEPLRSECVGFLASAAHAVRRTGKGVRAWEVRDHLILLFGLRSR